MAQEPMRGCGYRKVGGLYFVCDGPGFVCRKLPFNLGLCPVCSAGLHFSRGYTWINPHGLTGGQCAVPDCPLGAVGKRVGCPFDERLAGLMWIGNQFYTPESFTAEAAAMGISKRIRSVPRGFELGKTWVFLAHQKAGRKESCTWYNGHYRCKLSKEPCRNDDKDCPNATWAQAESPAIFYAFRPTRVELLVMARRKAAMDEDRLKSFADRGITLVAVPDDDLDHQGSVWRDLRKLAAAKNQEKLPSQEEVMRRIEENTEHMMAMRRKSREEAGQ